MTFRIVKYLGGTEQSNPGIEYVIEKKNRLFGWKEIERTEVNSKRVSHPTYEEAEQYMVKNYMVHGYYKQVGCVYDYTPYIYFY